MKKLFVGNLPYTVNNDELNSIFSAIGKVLSAVDISEAYYTHSFTNSQISLS